MQPFSSLERKNTNPSPLHLPIIPPPLPDETILSWLARTARCYGICVASLLDHLDPSADVFQLQHSERILSPSAELNTLLEKYLKVSPLRLGEFYPYSTYNLQSEFWLRNAMAWCPYCVAEDKEKFGFTYDRIDWWLVCITRCRKHDVFLHDQCPVCNSRGYMAIAPNQTRYLSCCYCSHKLEDLCIARVDAGYFPKPGDIWTNTSVRGHVGRDFEDRLRAILSGEYRDWLTGLEISGDIFLDILVVVHAFVEDTLAKAEWITLDSLPILNENSLAACKISELFDRLTNLAILARKLLPGLCPVADQALGSETTDRLSRYDLKQVIR